MLSNGSRGTLMSYTDHSVQRRFKSNAPTESRGFKYTANILPAHFCVYIYIYAFSRRFYPKRLTLHSSYSFYILSALAFPGNRTHDLGVANAMLYQLSYRKVAQLVCLNPHKPLFVCFLQLRDGVKINII